MTKFQSSQETGIQAIRDAKKEQPEKCTNATAISALKKLISRQCQANVLGFIKDLI